MKPRVIALRAAGVVLAITAGLAIDALVFASHILPFGSPMQVARLCAAATAVFGTWLCVRRRPAARATDVSPALRRAAWGVRIAAALATSQLLMTVDCALIGPNCDVFERIARGEMHVWLLHFGKLISSVETWLALALVALPIRAAVIARHALETGSPRELRAATLPAAVAFIATCVAIVLHEPLHELVGNGGSSYTTIALRLNPASFAFAYTEIRTYVAVAELVAAALVVASRFLLRDDAPDEPPGAPGADVSPEIFSSDVE